MKRVTTMNLFMKLTYIIIPDDFCILEQIKCKKLVQCILKVKNKQNISDLKINTSLKEIDCILTFNPNIIVVATGLEIKLIDLSTGNLIKSFSIVRKVDIMIKVNNTKIATYQVQIAEKLYIWDINTGICCNTFLFNRLGYVKFNSFTKISNSLIACCRYNLIKIWDFNLEKFQNEITLNKKYPAFTCIVKVDNRLAIGNCKGVIDICDLLNFKHIKTLSKKNKIDEGSVDMIIKLSKTKIASSSDMLYMYIWDVETYQCIQGIDIINHLGLPNYVYPEEEQNNHTSKHLVKIKDNLIAYVINNLVKIFKIEGKKISLVKTLNIESLRWFVKINKTQTIFSNLNSLEICVLDL